MRDNTKCVVCGEPATRIDARRDDTGALVSLCDRHEPLIKRPA